MIKELVFPVVLTVFLAAAAWSADWTNNGGNAGRNGLSDEIGPSSEDLLWSGGRESLIAWQPVTEGNRMFVVRQAGWPGDPDDSLAVAMNLTTGQELWAIPIPYDSGDWITWIAGVRNGLVYASRSGNGATVEDHLYALDVEDGHLVWVSEDKIDAGPYDGVVFAENGDPVVASFSDIWRIRSTDGTTMWHETRLGSVSGNCGGAIFGHSLYVADVAGGRSHVIARYDLNTGTRLYESPLMAGFTIQNSPMAGPDGTIYLSRVQNNPAVDYFFAFTDTGSTFVEKWKHEAAWTTSSEFCVGPDGSVYMVVPGPELARLNPEDGSIVDSVPIASPDSARLAADAAGTVYFSNGGFSNGRFSVYSADLILLWDTDVTNINIGGPAIGQDGILVLCGVGTDIRAYDTDETPMTPTPLETGTPTLTPTPSYTATPEPTATPIALGVRIDLPAFVHPADAFHVTGYLDNPGSELDDIPVFFILDVYGQYWFWDGWEYFDPVDGRIDYRVMDIPPGSLPVEVISEMIWPDTDDLLMEDLRFWGAMLDPDMSVILGRHAMAEWGFGPR